MRKFGILLLMFLYGSMAQGQNTSHLDSQMHVTTNEELLQLNDSLGRYFRIDTTYEYILDTFDLKIYHLAYFNKQSSKLDSKVERLLIVALLNNQVVYTRYFKAVEKGGLIQVSKRSIDSLYILVLPLLAKSKSDRFVDLNYNSLNFYGDHCGYAGNATQNGKMCCVYFILLGELDSLFHWIQTPYGGLNAYGLEGLYYLYNYGISYDENQMALIQATRKRKRNVPGCAGCIYGVNYDLIDISKPLKFKKRNMKFNNNY